MEARAAFSRLPQRRDLHLLLRGEAFRRLQCLGDPGDLFTQGPHLFIEQGDLGARRFRKLLLLEQGFFPGGQLLLRFTKFAGEAGDLVFQFPP